MTATFKAISKQLLGSRYEHIWKSLFTSVVIYFAFWSAGISLDVAPRMFYFMVTALSVGIVIQALFSESNTRNLTGLFMLPVSGKDFITAYITSIALYTLITKVLPILAIFLAVSDFSGVQIIVFFFCFFNAVLTATIIFIALKYGQYFALFILVVSQIAWCLLYGDTSYYIIGTLCSMFILIFILFRADFYVFYNGTSKSTHKVRRFSSSMFLYLFRYLISHKNYLINTVALWAFACFLPFLLPNFDGMEIRPLGLAILTFNTPLGILLSCNPSLEQKVRILPNQMRMFCIPYGLFLLLSNIFTGIIFLICWYFNYGHVSVWICLTAVVFALQSAIFSVGLEWFRPIRNWKIESDLWHHPRKYLAPGLMIFFAIITMMFPVFIYFFAVIVGVECIWLLFSKPF